jgi:carbonic anhydrase
MNISALEALEQLKEGNRRYVADIHVGSTHTDQKRRSELLKSQEPFAVILGCSDARVPAEIIFDQGLGDLFVIRIAGNIVASSQIGSVEFAVERFGTRLVVVLGHSSCGAVLATLEELENPVETRSLGLRAIVDRIKPSLQPLFKTGLRQNPDLLIREAIRVNINASVNHLKRGSKILEQFIAKDGLLIVGAEYSLERGVVDFFDR